MLFSLIKLLVSGGEFHLIFLARARKNRKKTAIKKNLSIFSLFFTFFRSKIKQNGSTTPYIGYGAVVFIKGLT
jgi:hypothetical protein